MMKDTEVIPDINDYNLLSKKVYDVDPLKGAEYSKNQKLHGTNYKILDISRNGTYGNKKQYGVAYVGNDSHAKLHRSKLC